MAARSLLTRVLWNPAAQVLRSSSFGTNAQLSFDSSFHGENACKFVMKPSGLSSSFPFERHGSKTRRAFVCRIPQIELEVPGTVESIPAGLETTRAALQGSFESEAAVGRVECTNRGCRPIFNDALVPAVLPDGWLAQEDAFEVLKSRTALYHSSRSSELDYTTKPHFPEDFAEFLNDVWMEKSSAQKYFEAALQTDPFNSKLLCEYAMFSWKLLKDMGKAEGLYQQALDAAPSDVDIVASYALFCWQSDS